MGACMGSKPAEEFSAAATTGGAAGSTPESGKPVVSKGKIKDKYKFGKKLGSGAYSEVFQGSDKSGGGTVVAIKQIKKDKLQKHDHEALKLEVEILSKCDHPNIMQYIDFYDEEKYYYLVTEEVSGGELFDRIVEKTVYDEHEARELIKILLETLAFLHQKKGAPPRAIVHRDLKPENLLLANSKDDSNIKLADFGFANYVHGRDMNQVCGTPDYVAPEIVDHAMYGVECDIWSAGVIAYILLGGYPPFQAADDDRDELFKVIKRGKYKFHDEYWRDISVDAKDLIAQMLSRNPDKRPSAVELLKHKWIGATEAELRAKGLSGTVEKIKEFNAKRKLKGVAKTIIATKRMEKGVISAFAASKDRKSSKLQAAAAAQKTE